MIDLRSDTITKPSKDMLAYMFQAEVGDDVFMDDPSVNQLQNEVAAMFSMEDALFCPSGTMANQIAIRIHTQPQDEVICHKYSHIYLYEGGGMMSNSQVSPKLLEGDRGLLSADQIETSINPDDIHFPRTTLVSLENTMNKGGGSTYDLADIQKIKEVCDSHSLGLHLDGARLFNAIVKNDEDPAHYGQLFDTISVCFSKGLGAPVGSVLLGSHKMIAQARRVRKVMGGGMRQAGYLAAACYYALNHNVDQLKIDHDHAKQLGVILEDCSYVKSIYPIETNIVIAQLDDSINEITFLDLLREKKILGVPFGKGLIRFVTHLDFHEEMLNEFDEAIRSIQK
ncbi:MAG: GntG family PLP-dependent aldolase [Bacteroidota bacterium]